MAIKFSLGVKFGEICTTYKFNYLSDGMKIEGYLSIPLSVEKTQKPGKCVMFNHGGNRQLGKLENNTTAPICAVCDRIVVASRYRGCGGVMTYPAARKDSRIKRIIALSAVCDLFEAYEARDDMKTVLKETLGSTPEESPEEYEKRSAVYWADEIKVPVLMFHAKLDKQVPYSQAEQLYAKLKNSTDCTFITYDDDIHGTVHPEDYQTIRNWLNQE